MMEMNKKAKEERPCLENCRYYQKTDISEVARNIAFHGWHDRNSESESPRRKRVND